MDVMRLFLASLQQAKPDGPVLCVGDQGGREAARLRDAGFAARSFDYGAGDGHFEDAWLHDRPFAGLWAHHVLEHSRWPGIFLVKCTDHLAVGGVLAITVPPLKHQIVGGHLTLWNAGLLLYNMIRAGIDCSDAAVRTYDYNVCVVVRYRPAELPALREDNGDIRKLARFFPSGLRFDEGSDGRIPEHRWRVL